MGQYEHLGEGAPAAALLPRSSGAALARLTRNTRVAPMLSDAMTGRFPRGVIRSAQSSRSCSSVFNKDCFRHQTASPMQA